MFGFKKSRSELSRTEQRNRFVLLFGVLAWGFPVGLIMTLVNSQADGWANFWPGAVVSMTFFTIGGVFFGLVLWKVFEWRLSVVRKLEEERRNA